MAGVQVGVSTPYGVETPRADVSTCQRFGGGLGMM